MDNTMKVKFSPFHVEEEELNQIWGHGITTLLVYDNFKASI